MGKERGSQEGENLRDREGAVKSLVLIPLVVSLFHIDKCTHSNSEPEKCCPTNRTIGSLLSWSKLNDIAEVHQIQNFFYKLNPVLSGSGFFRQ